jgi:tetratricopeptide (TPR) repeat protein
MLFSLIIAYFIFRPNNLQGVLIASLWLAGIIISVLLHEMGHTLAAQLLGVEVKSIVIWPLGGFTNLRRKPEKPLHNLLVSGSGPLINIAIMVLLGTLYFWLALTLPNSILGEASFPWVDGFMNLVLTLAFLNLILVVFNLLPIYPLDGGEMMRSALEMVLGKPRADQITMIVSIPVLLCLVMLGIFTRDYILLFFCVLIALAIGTLNRRSLHWVNLGVNYLFRREGYHYLQGDFDLVIQHFTREIERKPTKAQHYIGRATAYLNVLKKEMARADLERALKLEPDNVFANQLLGEVHGMEKDYETALKYSERTLQLKPNWAIPYFDLGAVHLELKEYQTALENFNKAITLMPQMPIFFLLRSMLHFRLGDLDLAHKDQEQALHLSPKDALTMIDVNLPVYEGYLDWAEDYYERVISGKNNLSFAYQGRADAYRINGKFVEAIADYTHALELSSRDARLYLGRGKAYQSMGDLMRARDDFRNAKEVTDKSHQKRQAEEYLKELE